VTTDTFIKCARCALLVWQDDPGDTLAGVPFGIPGNHEPIEIEGVAMPSETPVCPGSEMLGCIMRPRFTIVKWWPATPQLKQPATRETFSSRTEAERVKAELERAMPGRRFTIQEEQP